MGWLSRTISCYWKKLIHFFQYLKKAWRNSTEPSNLLSSINHLSQIGLLVVAVWAYFYTVKPVFTKEKLEEEAAQATLELKKTRSDLNKVIRAKVDLEKSLSATYSKLRNRVILEFYDAVVGNCSTPHRSFFENSQAITSLEFRECIQKTVSNFSNKNSQDLTKADFNLLTSLVDRLLSETKSTIYMLAERDKRNSEEYISSIKIEKVDSKYTEGQPWIGATLSLGSKEVFEKYINANKKIDSEYNAMVRQNMLKLAERFSGSSQN